MLLPAELVSEFETFEPSLVGFELPEVVEASLPAVGEFVEVELEEGDFSEDESMVEEPDDVDPLDEESVEVDSELESELSSDLIFTVFEIPPILMSKSPEGIDFVL